MKDWNEFIEIKRKKYGIPYVYNNIHMENNCFGNIKENIVYYKSFLRDNRSEIYQICENCNYNQKKFQVIGETEK